MYNEAQIDCLILGGTELPLVMKTSDFEDIELLNTTKIHVEHILDAALG